MAKKFKKNQPVIATLPTGRVVEGIYIEPYGSDGHSIYVDEYDGERGGKPMFKKIRYGVKDDLIEPSDTKSSMASEAQYKAWLKRAIILEDRIGQDKIEIDSLMKMGVEKESKILEKLSKKIKRNQSKLNQINEKINEFEG